MPRPWNDPKNGVPVPPEERSEVAIVGGGPAGAALAIRLAEGGIDVALFERWPAPRAVAAGPEGLRNVQPRGRTGKSLGTRGLAGMTYGSGEWAMRDLNPRPRACEARALTS